MTLPVKIFTRTGAAFLLALLCTFITHIIAYFIPQDMLLILGRKGADIGNLISYVPEVWLALLALVFGTLIIVISIASESTPKLIDLFVGDYRSRFYIWLITLSILENIILQLVDFNGGPFADNLIFINSYVLLPLLIILSIPYIFYILKYTKHSNVITKIYIENIATIRSAPSLANKDSAITESHRILFETINQLHDLLQYVQFKEPKADVIQRFGKSLRHFLNIKSKLQDSYFTLSPAVKADISFRTLLKKFDQIERTHTFYEQKLLRVFGASYMLLIQDSHYDLASLCGNELYESGKKAAICRDSHAVNVIIFHFNSMVRYGINHGLKTKEIRNIYNTIFHYGQLVSFFIDNRHEDRILRCSRYFTFYGNEFTKLGQSEPSFLFLIDAFAVEIKKILIDLHEKEFPEELEIKVLDLLHDLSQRASKRAGEQGRIHDNGVRLIQIALCLYYHQGGETNLYNRCIQQIIFDLAGFTKEELEQIVSEDCHRLANESEEFWEETDQGRTNIFYSPHVSSLPQFQHDLLLMLVSIA